MKADAPLDPRLSSPDGERLRPPELRHPVQDLARASGLDVLSESLPKTSSTGGTSGFPADWSMLAFPPTCVNPLAAPCSGMRFVLPPLTAMRALSADRNPMAIENLVLRQQINVLRRGAKRVRLNDSDRAFWVQIRRFSSTGRNTS